MFCCPCLTGRLAHDPPLQPRKNMNPRRRIKKIKSVTFFSPIARLPMPKIYLGSLASPLQGHRKNSAYILVLNSYSVPSSSNQTDWWIQFNLFFCRSYRIYRFQLVSCKSRKDPNDQPQPDSAARSASTCSHGKAKAWHSGQIILNKSSQGKPEPAIMGTFLNASGSGSKIQVIQLR